jgi:hypothetical protein
MKAKLLIFLLSCVLVMVAGKSAFAEKGTQGGTLTGSTTAGDLTYTTPPCPPNCGNSVEEASGSLLGFTFEDWVSGNMPQSCGSDQSVSKVEERSTVDTVDPSIAHEMVGTMEWDFVDKTKEKENALAIAKILAQYDPKYKSADLNQLAEEIYTFRQKMSQLIEEDPDVVSSDFLTCRCGGGIGGCVVNRPKLKCCIKTRGVKCLFGAGEESSE